MFRSPAVLLALPVAFALAFGAGSLGTSVASAAGVNIAPSSCGGVGHPNCLNLPADVTIGAHSCTVTGSCDDLGNGVTIGKGSCNDGEACHFASGSIGDNSCNADTACFQNAFLGGTGSVGDDSCNASSGCFQNGLFEGSDGRIGNNSCNGLNACFQNGYQSTASIGDYSCNVDNACFQNGYGDTNTCSLGSPGVVSECGLIDSGVLIGNLSCNQSGAYDSNCQGFHEDVGNCMYNDTTPVLCTQGTIQVVKVVVGDSNDRFNLEIDGFVQAWHVGNGGTTDPVAVDPGTHSSGESAVYPARLSDYDQRTTCEAYNAIVGSHPHTIAPRTRGTAVFSVKAGDVVTCTITNTKLTSSWWHKTR